MLLGFFKRGEGQGLVEYALILVLIAVVVIGIVTLLDQQAVEPGPSPSQGTATP
ncbi:MAG TPA: hypothetical protein VEZ12_00080 [Herpetosiphonaceae bacterium]|nr:hypothetical protein [Herpetosiphonaceae bacterium]